MKSKFFTQFAAVVLSVQLAGVPSAMALAVEADEPELNEFQQEVIDGFEKARDEGWEFFDQEQEAVDGVSLAAAFMETKSFYAVSPVVEGLGRRLNVHFDFEGSSIDNGLVFRMAVLNSALDHEITARKFEISFDPKTAEETKLKVARAFRSVAAEVELKKDQLASVDFTDHIFNGLKSIGNFIIPSAFAEQSETKPLKSATAAMLQKVAGGACFLGVMMLLFGYEIVVKTNDGGKNRLSGYGIAAILVFVVGGGLWIASGVVEDNYSKSNP